MQGHWVHSANALDTAFEMAFWVYEEDDDRAALLQSVNVLPAQLHISNPSIMPQPIFMVLLYPARIIFLLLLAGVVCLCVKRWWWLYKDLALVGVELCGTVCDVVPSTSANRLKKKQ